MQRFLQDSLLAFSRWWFPVQDTGTKSSPFSNLPAEILVSIFKVTARELEVEARQLFETWGPKNGSSRSASRSCRRLQCSLMRYALVCRAWKCPAVQILYSHPVLSEYRQIEGFIKEDIFGLGGNTQETLDRRAALLKEYIEGVYILISPEDSIFPQAHHDFASIIQEASHLKSAHIAVDDMNAWFLYQTLGFTLDNLSLCSYTRVPEPFASIVRGAPLKSLALQGHVISSYLNMTEGLTLPQLTSLAILEDYSGGDPIEACDIKITHTHFPHLTSLEVTRRRCVLFLDTPLIQAIKRLSLIGDCNRPVFVENEAKLPVLDFTKFTSLKKVEIWTPTFRDFMDTLPVFPSGPDGISIVFFISEPTTLKAMRELAERRKERSRSNNTKNTKVEDCRIMVRLLP